MKQQNKIFLKRGCPFSFKFLLFVTEAGLLDQFEVVELSDGEAEMDQVRELLNEKLGKATFPTVETSEGKFINDSDALIDYFATANNIEVENLSTLELYSRVMMPRMGQLFRENMRYKKTYGELES